MPLLGVQSQTCLESLDNGNQPNFLVYARSICLHAVRTSLCQPIRSGLTMDVDQNPVNRYLGGGEGGGDAHTNMQKHLTQNEGCQEIWGGGGDLVRHLQDSNLDPLQLCCQVSMNFQYACPHGRVTWRLYLETQG